MLIFSSPADVPDNLPARKLWVLILLMMLRDRADRLRLTETSTEIRVAYRVDREWYDLVPPPVAMWPALVAEVYRAAGRLVTPELAGALQSVGWLTFRLGGTDQLFLVRIHSEPEASELTLEPVGEGISPGVANATLLELVPAGADGLQLFEFDFPDQ